jgi:hypothetical protein
MTIKEIIKMILCVLSMFLFPSLMGISVIFGNTWCLIAMIVNCIAAVVWLIEGLSNYHIYSIEWYDGKKTYHIGDNDSPVRAMGFVTFGLLLFMLIIPLTFLLV